MHSVSFIHRRSKIIELKLEHMKNTSIKKRKISINDICLIGIMVAVIEVCKLVLSFLPNVELTSFWLIMFTLFFGWKVAFVVPVFILIEGCVYGFGSWWIMYLYTWPLLVLVVWLCRKQTSPWFFSVLSGVFGLLFGLFCSLPYVVMGAWDGGIHAGLRTGFTWWVAGIPWDLVHGIANFVLMLVLYQPIYTIMQRMKKRC